MGPLHRVLVPLLAMAMLQGCSLYVDRHHGGVTKDAAAEDGAAEGDAATTVCGVCPGDKPLCDEKRTECVACLSDSDCSDTAAGHCFEGKCGICGNNDHCEHFDDAHELCDRADGACVGCNVATEVADCGEYTCDPNTRQCTNVERNTLNPCEPCVSDTQCANPSGNVRRCVPTDFMGQPHGTFCLADRAFMPNAKCLAPLGGATVRTSVGGVKAAYCAPVFGITTCEAVSQVGNQCAEDDDCGATDKDDGLCRDDNGTLRCTYGCSLSTDCLTGRSCVPDAIQYCCVSGNC